MGSRLDLQTQLEAVLGSKNVYFQPPENLKIKYPAIVYSLGSMHVRHANNRPYIKGKSYTVILIHFDPDNTIKDQLLELPYSSMVRAPYKVDNLYHYVFEIYF